MNVRRLLVRVKRLEPGPAITRTWVVLSIHKGADGKIETWLLREVVWASSIGPPFSSRQTLPGECR